MENYEEIKMPEHHRILPSDNLLVGKGIEGDLDIYGTSTALNILYLDKDLERMKELEDKIKNTSQKLRELITKILDEDDLLLLNEKNYENNTFFDIFQLCKFNLYLVLLPFTVSKDTFYTFYTFYEELIQKRSTYTEMFEEEKEEKEEKSDFFSKAFSKKKTIYKKDCFNYINAIKQYLRLTISNDDYIINSYKYMIYIFDYKKSLVKELQEIVDKNIIGKMCNYVLYNVRNQYKTRYVFDEILKDEIKYKIIPKGFLFYRSYPSISTPFPIKRPYMYVGFSFLDIIDYATPQEKNFDERNLSYTSHNYCELLGNVSTFKTKRTLKLLDLHDLQTVKSLRKLMDGNVLKSFEKGWEIKNDIIERNSDFVSDGIVSQWIYENGYDGFIGYGIKGLHDECLITSDNIEKKEWLQGMGLNFPLELKSSFPIKQLVPICQEPFTKINYKISLS